MTIDTFSAHSLKILDKSIEEFKNKPLEYYHTKDVAPEAIVASCKFDISEILEADETEESCELTSRAIIQDCLDRMK